VHVVHLADADSLPLLKAAKQEGLPITVETCSHYLHFAAEEIPDGATEFKCAPPVRESIHRERLWQALSEDVIDLIASDHSPCPPEMKGKAQGDFMSAWGGIASLQLGLSIIWTGARKRRLSLEHLAKWTSRMPAALAGRSSTKGQIASGHDADFVVFDPNAMGTVDAARLYHRHKVTPYAGEKLHGRVLATYLRGAIVFRDGSIVTTRPTGEALRDYGTDHTY
jgi:allantoinase